MPRDDQAASFRIDTTSAGLLGAPPEPQFGTASLQVEFDEERRLELARAPAQPQGPSQLSRRTLSAGMLVSLAAHLSPLLLLVSWSWNSAPAEIVQPIPVALVIEQPPPEPKPEPQPEPKAEKAPPPPAARLASIDMGAPAKEPEEPASTPDPAAEDQPETQTAAVLPPPKPPPPELVSALPKPTPPPEPVTAVPPPEPEPAPPAKPAIKRAVATPAPPKPHPAQPLRMPGPAATRDEYLAYITTLINRNSNLLSPSLLAGRHGVAVISIMVLGDGTIARIAIKRGSGHPDIDVRVEQMVAAVRRFPPLPQWIQAPSVILDYHRVFPSH